MDGDQYGPSIFVISNYFFCVRGSGIGYFDPVPYKHRFFLIGGYYIRFFEILKQYRVALSDFLKL